jgi:acyl carrier protein
MELQNKVFDRIAEQFKTDRASLSPETTLLSLGADSLDMVELAMELEDEHGFAIEQTDISTIKTLGDVVKLIETKKK